MAYEADVKITNWDALIGPGWRGLFEVEFGVEGRGGRLVARGRYNHRQALLVLVDVGGVFPDEADVSQEYLAERVEDVSARLYRHVEVALQSCRLAFVDAVSAEVL